MHQFIRKAFTLIELLVVIAIIGILSGLIVVAMGGMTQKATIAKAQVFSNSLRNSLMLNTVAQYSFDDITDYNSTTRIMNSTAGNVPDSWGANEGQAYGGPTLKEENICISGHCLSFDGTDDYILSGSVSGFSGNIDITIASWMYWNNDTWSSEWPATVSINPGTSNQGVSVTFSSGKPAIDFWNNRYRAQNALIVKNWYYVVVTKSPGNISSTSKIYVNGVLVGGVLEGTDGIPNIGNNVINIGRLDLNRYFNGLIDDVRIFNAVVPAFQIKEQYYAGLNDLLTNGAINQQEYAERISSVTIKE